MPRQSEPSMPRRRASGKIKVKVIVGSKRERKQRLSRLPQFEPFLVSAEPPLDEKARSIKTEAVLAQFKMETERQIDEVLKALGYNRSDPHAWEKAFRDLVEIHHGGGAIAARIDMPSNRHASRWTLAQDDLLVSRVDELRAKGHSISAALKIIAKDSRFCEKLPKPSGQHSTANSANRRSATFKKRLQTIQKLTLTERLERALYPSPTKGFTRPPS